MKVLHYVETVKIMGNGIKIKSHHYFDSRALAQAFVIKTMEKEPLLEVKLPRMIARLLLNPGAVSAAILSNNSGTPERIAVPGSGDHPDPKFEIIVGEHE